MFKSWENDEPTSIKGDIARSVVIGLPMHALTSTVCAANTAFWAASSLSATHVPVALTIWGATTLGLQALVTASVLATRSKTTQTAVKVEELAQ